MSGDDEEYKSRLEELRESEKVVMHSPHGHCYICSPSVLAQMYRSGNNGTQRCAYLAIGDTDPTLPYDPDTIFDPQTNVYKMKPTPNRSGSLMDPYNQMIDRKFDDMQTEKGMEEAVSKKRVEMKLVRRWYQKHLLNDLDQAMNAWYSDTECLNNTSRLQFEIRTYFDNRNNVVRVKKELNLMSGALDTMKKKRYSLEKTPEKTPKKLKFTVEDTKPSPK